jgi:maleylpyruvate isomerase
MQHGDPGPAAGPGPSAGPDPAARALAAVEQATQRLLGTAARLTDAEAREPSRLPGWTRGHVLTHVARNADGFCHLLAWARTGVQTPMYRSEAARDADIAAGAGRGAAALLADVRDSAARFAAAAAGLPATAWAAEVARRGQRFPAWEILARRRSEVEIHHVDLGAGYQPGDWPGDFARAGLARVAGDLAGRADLPPLVIRPDGAAGFRIGPRPGPGPAGPPSTPGTPGPEGPVTVSGSPGVLLAWLTGRGDGAGLRVTGAAALPALPPWR